MMHKLSSLRANKVSEAIHSRFRLGCFVVLLLVMTIVFHDHANAQTTPAPAPVHAIAMHGTPKHAAGFSSLPYAYPNATQGGTFRQCSIGTFDTLNDNTMKGKPAEGLFLLNDSLMRRVWDEPFGLYGLIAKQVILPEDRSSITFLIDPNARFHDGTPITADDVKFSFETLKDKGKPNTRNVYKLVKKVTVENLRRIRFDFGDGYNRETAMILAMMPIYSKSYWEGREFDATTLTPPLGNGPYKIKSVNGGKSITYEKITDYWAKSNPLNIGHNNFDFMTYDYYRDEQVAMEAFKSGNCDLRRETNPAKWLVNYDPNAGYKMAELSHSRPEPTRGFIMNTRRTPLNDIEVRKALVAAFDFDWMNTSLFHGKARQIRSTFANSPLAASPDEPAGIALSKRDRLKKAAAILDKAGWPLKNGKRFSLTLVLNNPAEEKIALGYARDLQRLGITLNIRTLDTAQFTGALNDYDYDLVSWRWINSLSPGTEQAIYWGCLAAQNKGSRNYTGICDPAIDETIRKMADAQNYDDLTALAKDLDKQVMNHYLFVPLYYIGTDYVAYWPSMHHPDQQSLYGMVLETWWKDTTAQPKS